MAKKEKEQKPVLNLDGKEYVIEDMTDTQKEMAAQVMRHQDHVNDVRNKLATNRFIAEQLAENEKSFSEKHQKGVVELKKSLEPEEVEAEA
jgi:hypothetical protein